MTSQEIDKYFEKLQEKNRWIRLYSSYAYGDNYKIKHKEDEPKPDNKIPVPLAKSAITDIVGYAGRPNEIVTEYVHFLENSKEEDDDITDLLASFDEHNKEGIENSELLTKSLSLGISWELWYISDEMQLPNGMQTPEYKILKNEECLPNWSRDIKPRLENFMRFWCDDDYEYLDIYYPFYSERYSKKRKTENNVSPDWIRDVIGDTRYPYSIVPLNPFRTNMRDEPVFKAQLPLLDAYDSAMSKMANEVDRFNAAIILLAGLMGSEDKQKLLEGKTAIFDDLGQFSENGNLSAAISYLTKNLAGVEGFYKEFLDRDERHFRETIKIPNMQDEAFAGNQSGIAIRYKLIGLEFLVSEIEVYFRQGLEKRFKMYQDIINESTLTVNWEEYEQKISWKRNLPVDDKEKVEIAAMLMGLGLTLGQVIKFLPNAIVENMTEDEIAQMLKDKQTEQVNRNQPGETDETK
jgi:SPP1 family phage portal protein